MKRSNEQIINLSEEQKQKLMREIHDFFDSEYGEDIGIIKQSRILDLFLEQLGPMIFNKGLDDAMRMVKQSQENFEADFYTLYKDEN